MRVVTRWSYDNALHYGLCMFAEFEKFPYPLLVRISVRFQKPFDLLLSMGSSQNSFKRIKFYSLSDDFIVAHCTFTTNLSSKFKCQFQVILVQGSFPLNMSSFQTSLYCRTLRTVSSLMNGGMPAITPTLFTKKFPISSCKHLVCCKIFLFCQTDSFVSAFQMPAHGCFW